MGGKIICVRRKQTPQPITHVFSVLVPSGNSQNWKWLFVNQRSALEIQGSDISSMLTPISHPKVREERQSLFIFICGKVEKNYPRLLLPIPILRQTRGDWHQTMETAWTRGRMNRYCRTCMVLEQKHTIVRICWRHFYLGLSSVRNSCNIIGCASL